MMKKLFCIFFLTICLITTTIAVSASDEIILSGSCGTSATWQLDTSYTLTIEGTGTITSSPWDSFASLITKIVVGDEITQINSGIFKACTALEEITLPFVGRSANESDGASDYKNVFGYIFGYSDSKKDGTTSQGGANFLKYFYIPKTLKKVTITNTTTIPSYSFKNCSFLTEIIIPSNITEIGYEAFYQCSGITEIIFPKTLVNVDGSAFSGCSSLTAVHISDIDSWFNINFNYSTSNPLYYAKKLYLNGELVTDITIPNTCTVINGYALYNAECIKNIIVPETVTLIGREAFRGCKAITKIIVPNSVTEISYAAFQDCTALEEITLPFVGRSATTTSEIESTFGYIFGYESIASNPSHYPSVSDATYQGYKGGNYYPKYYYFIPKTITKISITNDEAIPNRAFYGCDFLKEIVLTGDTKTIGSSAFDGCRGLTSFSFTSSMETIATYAFSSYAQLTDIYFEGSRNDYLAIEGVDAFDGKSVHFNDSGSCGDATTWEITYDNTLIIEGEGSITTTGYLAYFDIVKNIKFGKDVTPIQNAKFTFMTSNTAFSVDEANQDYKSVDGMILSKDGKTLVAVPVNYGETCMIPDGVEIIAANALQGCKITTLTIPESVTAIETNAFGGCSSLSAIDFAGTSSYWNSISVASGNNALANAAVTFGKYSVTYDLVNGEGDFAEQIKNKGESLVLHTNIPTREGHAFKGWATTTGGNVKYKSGASYTEDSNVVLYAVWELDTYAITYDANGGSGAPAAQTKTYGINLNLSATTPKRTGYTFNGWSTEANGLVEYGSSDTYTKNEPVTLYAIWSANSYTISYNANSGSGRMPVSYHTYDAYAPLNTAPFTKTGYTFAGWATTSTGAVIYSDNESVKNLASAQDANVTLYAVWEANTYTVTYNSNGGNGAAYRSTYTYDSKRALNANTFTKLGHTFKGWATEPEGTVVYADKESILNLTSEPNGNINIYAVWEINKYAVTYNANGGANAPTAQTKVFGTELVLTSEAPSKVGYTFKGWSTEYDGAVEYKSGEAYYENAAITFYAVWEANAYTIAYNANGGSGNMSDTNCTYDVSIALRSNAFTKAGYTFGGWSTEVDDAAKYDNGEKVKNLSTQNNDTITLYAVWVANTYSIKYNANGGSGNMSNPTCVYDASYELKSNAFVKTGYTFEGWATASNGEVIYTDNNVVKNLTVKNGDIINLYAIWAANSYSITYDANGGNGNMSDTVCTYDKEASVSENNFEKEGHTFKGWATTKNGNVVYANNEIVKNLTAESNGVITLYAVWEINTYTIAYDANGGSEAPAPQTKIFGIDVGITEKVPVKEGHTFKGWAESSSSEVAFAPQAVYSANSDITLYAVWSINSYKVTYKLDGEIYKTVEYQYGAKLNEIEAPQKDGYEFSGWSDSPINMPAHDIEIVGSFKYVKADVDGDGIISVKDVLVTIKAVINGTALDGADMNGDGKVSLLDVIRLLNAITA